MNTVECGVLVTYEVLVRAALPCTELKVLPSNEQKQEEGQHEELPVPYRHNKDLRRQDVTV